MSACERMGCLAAGTVALAMLAAGPAAAGADLIVTVFPGHYVVDGRLIDDLGALETAVRRSQPGAVRLHACGSGTERAQMGAAHRFRDRYLELRRLDVSDAQCRASMAVKARKVSVSDRRGLRPYGIDEEAVTAWMTATMP